MLRLWLLRLGVVRQTLLLLGLDCADALHKVFVLQFLGASTKGQHASLHADSLQLGAIKVLSTPCQLIKVDI